MPFTAGAHAGMIASFTILGFPDTGGASETVYIEAPTGSLYLEKQVEVATLPDGGRAVRDSKHPDGPALHFTATEWAAFLAGAQDGEFDQ
ncbi:Scr1 family TA system antitoxin-like transcriptional regulator [Frankia sp. CiP3]|uniref:DUF397 domain-containing protein n=1 Tax=Frankia sp. CiP3 TaxID=2880971 RepID=UPI0035ABDE50